MSFAGSPKLATIELIFMCLTKAPDGKIPIINAEERGRKREKKKEKDKKRKRKKSFKKLKN